METNQHNPAHENDPESTVVRFDDGAKKAARPVVPLGRAFRRGARGTGRPRTTWPLGLFIILGLVLAAAALAGGFYHETHQDNITSAPAAAVAEVPPAAPQAVIEAAASAAVDTEVASEPATETLADTDATLPEQASLPRRYRARSGPSFSYANEDEPRRRDDKDKDAEKRIERARKEAEKRAEHARKEAEKQAEHARKEAEKMAERARDEAKDRAEKRRREREKNRDQKSKLVGVYTLRSKH